MRWWESDFLEVRANRLHLAGRDAEELAAKHGTPLFVYGRDRILARYRGLRDTLAAAAPLDPRVFYAMKANFHAGILRVLAAAGAWVDVVSPNELRQAMRAGFPPARILYTGTSVSPKDIEEAFDVEGLVVNIDAVEELEIMREVAKASFRNRRIRVSVRWNPGSGTGFSPKTVTAGVRAADGTPIKFGVEDGKVVPLFLAARDCGFVPVGLHQHLGSGWVREDYGIVLGTVDRMARKAVELEKLGFRLEFLDLGGGFGPKYYRNQHVFPVEEYLKDAGRRISKAGSGIGALAVEPGKYLVGDAGVLLLRVVYVKESYGNLFACVDGGTFNTVPRPAIYMQARHEVVNAHEVDGPKKSRISVAGHLCETGDLFGKERLMPIPRKGGLLAVLTAGAYCRSMASSFNMRDIPREILI